MRAALQAGGGDAVWVVEPFLTAATAAGGRVVAANYVDAAPNLTVATYFTSVALTKPNPDLVKRLTEALTESLRYADAHPAEVRQAGGSDTHLPPAAAPRSRAG